MNHDYFACWIEGGVVYAEIQSTSIGDVLRHIVNWRGGFGTYEQFRRENEPWALHRDGVEIDLNNYITADNYDSLLLSDIYL